MPYVMYVALQEDDKILTFDVDAETGELTPLRELPLGGGPAPLAVDPERRFLYAARRGSKELSSFRIDSGDGSLEMIGTASLETDPCFLSTDRKGRFVMAAYYEGSMVTVHPVGDDGAVAESPCLRLPTARGAHSIQTDPSNTFAFVPHIAGNGPNTIFQFRFDEETGQLTPNDPARVSPEEQLGPRHFCFHPSSDTVYFSNEQGCSVTAYRFDGPSGTLNPFQTVTTLPHGYAGQNSCSQIQITPDGKALYAPNRGHNSIACFAVDPATRRLTPMGRVPAEPVPRAIGLDPQGKFLFAAGLESGRLTTYRVNRDTAELEPLETYAVGNRPMWVMVIELPGDGGG